MALTPLVARPVLRARPGQQQQLATRVLRRLESSAAAGGRARELQARAQQGLSRVAGAAGPALAGAARGVGSALGSMGGRTGRLVAFVERQTPFVVYYSKVGLEMARLVFQGQKMSPPSMATFQTYYQNVWRALQSGAVVQAPQSLLQRARSIGAPQLVAAGVVAAECLGFFTVGEMVGRLKLVGYHSDPGHHHH